MRRIIVVRHGESEANVAGRLDCAVPGPGLTALGRSQADAVVEWLSDVDVASVWASSMTRAQQTAAPLAAATGQDVQVLDGFREVTVGELEGRTDDDAHDAFRAVYTRWMVDDEMSVPVPGGETGAEVLNRYLTSLDVVSRTLESDSGVAVVFSHGASTRLAASRRGGVDRVFALENPLLNGSGVVLEQRAAGWECTSWNGGAPILRESPG